MLKSLARRYKTWRHGRGFGVHSPLAYRLVTQVLRPQRDSRFYAEKGVALFAGGKRRGHIAATLLRLVADRNPRKVTVADNSDDAELWRRIVATAAPAASVTLSPGSMTPERADGCDLLIIGRGGRLPEQLPAFADELPGTYLLFVHSGRDDREYFERLKASGALKAMIIDSRRDIALAIVRRGLPPQTIEARF